MLRDELRHQYTRPRELLHGHAPVLTGLVLGRIDGSDAEELEHQLAPLGRRLAAEAGDLLLLGEHRCPEGGVVHAEDGAHIAGRVAHALGHLHSVGVGLGLHRGVDPRDRAAHDVEVTLVLELDLGPAVGVQPRGTDLVVRRASAAVEGEPDGLHQAGLAGAVGAVDADEARRELEVEVLIDPVVP